MERLAHRPPRKLVASAEPSFRPAINKRSKRISSECTWWDRLSSPAWEQAEKLRNHLKKTKDEIEEDAGADDEDFAFLYEEIASSANGSLQLDVAEETLEEGAMSELDYSNFEQDISEQRQSTSRKEKYFEDQQITDDLTATQQVQEVGAVKNLRF